MAYWSSTVAIVRIAIDVVVVCATIRFAIWALSARGDDL